MISITKDLGYFAAAHTLPYHGGGCANLHGHNYGVKVTVTGEIERLGTPTHGMIIDFSSLKTIWKEIHNKIDHSTIISLNPPMWYRRFDDAIRVAITEGQEDPEISVDSLLGKVFHMPVRDTTAECMVEWIAQEFQHSLPQGITVTRVELSETESSVAIWEAE
jgi:queuosine biosynthesis protein QueD